VAVSGLHHGGGFPLLDVVRSVRFRQYVVIVPRLHSQRLSQQKSSKRMSASSVLWSCSVLPVMRISAGAIERALCIFDIVLKHSASYCKLFAICSDRSFIPANIAGVNFIVQSNAARSI
jgi:hypothetical protein